MGQYALPIVAVMFISLFFSSLFISYFSMEMLGTKSDIIPLPDNEMANSQSQQQNFQSNNYSLDLLEIYGTWKKDSVGMVLVSNPLLSSSSLYIKNIQPDSNKLITMNYQINNSPLKDYQIVLLNDNLYPMNNNIINIKSDGIHVPATSFYLFKPETWGADRVFIPYANANKIQYVNIQTIYDGDNAKAIITFNGNTYELNGININTENAPMYNVFNKICGGVTSAYPGFTFVAYSTPNTISATEYKPAALDTLTSLWNLITGMLKVLSWGLPKSVMPYELQLLLIRSQEAVLFLGLVDWWRG